MNEASIAPTPNADTIRAIAEEWLAEMQSCVRAVDFQRCRAIFAPDVIGFGTRTGLAVGLDELEKEQWRHVWGKIREFAFDMSTLTVGGSTQTAIWLACCWSSEGPGTAGGWNIRPGRMTAVLERHGEHWLAVHTHHSLVPT